MTKSKILSKNAKIVIFLLFFVFLFETILFPVPVLASETSQKALSNDNSSIPGRLPENLPAKARKVSYHTLTAYNSEAAQCDNTPCVTANGFNVCEHGKEDTIAANFLKFGTRVRIPELFGDRVFIVRDRMNQRYTDRIDIWMVEKQDARKFGVKVAKVEVL